MDKINPDHYKSHPSGVECIEITQHHDFLIGNAIKYLWRAGLKNEATEVEDLKKAVWYIERKIKVLEKQKPIKFSGFPEPIMSNEYTFVPEILCGHD